MFGLPFDPDDTGRFYRGNIHCHSTNSDGRLEPEEVVRRYREQGYDFIALTDHFIERFDFPISDTSAYRTDGFTTIFGAELHAPALDNGQSWHIVAAGLPLDFPPTGDQESGPELAARAIAAGAFVGIAHPAWNGVKMVDVAAIEDAHAIEIFNTGHRADADRGDGWFLADLVAIEGRRILGYAADDAHFNGRPDHFGGWVMVRAAELTPEALVEALKDGQFYSSQGPTIEDVSVDDENITIRCSPAASIHAAGEPPLNRFVHAEPGETITEATFPVQHFGGRSCRLTVVDREGRRAWTNPFWLDAYGPGLSGIG
ncbi:MAG TPA: CehA/McbA family metallohydrolase [Thermomicrobiales bacterium]|nr:CehA/McbA family metallohydrolase [Thermomicrobiales bacterium]